MIDESQTSDANLAFSRVLNFNPCSVSPEILEQSRKNTAHFLQAIDKTTAVAIAEMMGVHESTISRLKSSGTLSLVCLAMACAGMKVVPMEAIVYLQPEQYK